MMSSSVLSFSLKKIIIIIVNLIHAIKVSWNPYYIGWGSEIPRTAGLLTRNPSEWKKNRTTGSQNHSKKNAPFALARARSNIDARLAVGVLLQFQELVRHVEVVILVLDQQVAAPMRSAHHHHRFAGTQHHVPVAVFCPQKFHRFRHFENNIFPQISKRVIFP